MKVIMVPVADRPECRIALDHAFSLATQLSANIVGYHLRPHRVERAKSYGPRVTVILEETELPPVVPADQQLNRANAEKLFRQMAQEHGVAIGRKPRRADHSLAFWHELVGTPGRLFGIIGPTCDCVVVSRPKRKASGPARAFMLAALLHSRKPLLIVPQRTVRPPGKRILVAWNQKPQAAAAVAAALPLLARAEAVHIVSCGKEELPGPKSMHLRNYLLHWGIEAELHQRSGHNPAAEILKVFKASRCDLLVMGAYSRGQLRERILGGVTHEMLTEYDVAVFALHA